MSDTIKCACQNCGAKYRLPVESQGRKARCKKCGGVFEVPRLKPKSLEDSILNWLAETDSEEEAAAPPRVINMPAEAADPEAARKIRGVIRRKDDSVKTS